jgi:hypothetical protein
MKESKPISAMMGIAIDHVQRAFKLDMDHIVRTALHDGEVDFQEGWKFDPQARTWTREVPDAPDTPPAE